MHIHCTYLWLDVLLFNILLSLSLSYLPISLCCSLSPCALFLMWWFCHLQRCVMLNISPAVAGACGEGRKKGKEEKWTEEWFVVPGSCSFGKCNGRWLFKVSPICHKCSLQMDTYNSSLPRWGAAVCQRSREHVNEDVWLCVCVHVFDGVCLSKCYCGYV